MTMDKKIWNFLKMSDDQIKIVNDYHIICKPFVLTQQSRGGTVQL